MNVSDYLSDDGMVLLALCSGFALPEGSAAGETAPFTLSEWNKLARQVHDSPLKQPAALQGRTAADLPHELATPRPTPNALSACWTVLAASRWNWRGCSRAAYGP